MKRAVFYSIGALLVLFLVSCDLPRENRPSVLVVAVEGLAFEKVSCENEENPAGPDAGAFQTLCQESVRFSHAYAPSTMSQATLASLLTGLYPFDHGVRHNGSDFLSARMRTLAEGALANHYRTFFISGGPPIWRKSGLAQGFEIFEDNVDINPGVYYRPAGEVFRIAENWIQQEVHASPFLGVLYLGDMQFPQIETRTKEGEFREKSLEAQIAELDESMGDFFRWLRVRKRWNSTSIILAGLNSVSPPNGGEVSSLNLKSASVQVTLFIKPARKERDNIIQWGVDRNVSLVDVGHTLFQILGLEPPVSSLPALQPKSLLEAINQPEPNWNEDRLVLTETGWPDWLEGTGVRWAIRQKHFLYIHDQNPLIFNTLTDRLENYPLKVNDPLWTSLNASILGMLESAQTPMFRGMQAHWPEQLSVARELWIHGQAPAKVQGNEPWAKWVLSQRLTDRNWSEVKRLSREAGDPVGTYVAARHLGEHLPLPRHACVRLLLATKGDKKTFQSECEDERLLALYAWRVARSDEEKIQAQDRFLRLYIQQWLDQQIGRANFLNDLRWDVDRSWPESPSIVDYLLTLKEFEPFAKRLVSILAGKELRF